MKKNELTVKVIEKLSVTAIEDGMIFTALTALKAIRYVSGTMENPEILDADAIEAILNALTEIRRDINERHSELWFENFPNMDTAAINRHYSEWEKALKVVSKAYDRFEKDFCF